MTTVEVHFCVPCGHLDRAEDVQVAIRSEFGQEVDAVTLRTDSGGVFTVSVDCEPVFDVDDEEYDPDAIDADVRERL